jgi:hypothetical protein
MIGPRPTAFLLDDVSRSLQRHAVLLKQHASNSGSRHHPNPVARLPLTIEELERGVVTPDLPPISSYRQFPGVPNEEMPRGSTHLPAGTGKLLLHLLPTQRLHPFLDGAHSGPANLGLACKPNSIIAGFVSAL